MDIQGDTRRPLWLNGWGVQTVRVKLKGTDIKSFIVPDDAGAVLLKNGVAELA